jgi:hypothetical protein
MTGYPCSTSAFMPILAVTDHIVILRVMIRYNQVRGYRRFEETYCSLLQSSWKIQALCLS